jgi:hypothetical protein
MPTDNDTPSPKLPETPEPPRPYTKPVVERVPLSGAGAGTSFNLAPDLNAISS